jgi:TPR repeat protein
MRIVRALLVCLWAPLVLAAPPSLIDGCPADAVRRGEPGANDFAAQYCLGISYRDGIGVEKHRLSALRWLNRAAAGENTAAQFALGKMFVEQQRWDQASQWLERAAKSGNADAANELGEMLFNGRGVKADRARALTLFQQAAKAGHVLGELNLGMAQIATKAAPVSTGLRHVVTAAGKGEPRAQYELGELMILASKQRPTPQSPGVRIVLKAAQSGHTLAQLRTADLFETVMADTSGAEAEAEDWYREATKSSDKALADYAYAQLDRIDSARRRLEIRERRPSSNWSQVSSMVPQDSMLGLVSNLMHEMNFIDSGKSFGEAIADTMNVALEFNQKQLEPSGVFFKTPVTEDPYRPYVNICVLGKSPRRVRFAIWRDYSAKVISHPGLSEVPFVARGWGYVNAGECKEMWAANITYVAAEEDENGTGKWQRIIWLKDEPLSEKRAIELAAAQEPYSKVFDAVLDEAFFCGSGKRDFKVEATMAQVEDCRRTTGLMIYQLIVISKQKRFTIRF